MTDLGTLPGGGYSYAEGVNQAGQVVDDIVSQQNGYGQPFLCGGGAAQDMEALGGLASAAMAVNDSGQVVGDATNSSGADYAFPMAQETTHAPPSNKSERSSC